MTKTKSTKHALLMSGIALLLCVSMLIGSTYAWFTDSVTSAGNKIVAGKLDIQLLMNADGNCYTDISDSTSPIFGAGSIAQNNNAETLWEPGKTQVAYLAIKNNGNLDLKYTVGLNVVNVKNDLYEVMEYAIVPDAQYGSVTSWTSGNSVVEGTQSVSDNVALKAGATHYFALAIHMDEEAGNKYQEGEVNFDLTVLATQLASESDSFNNQYDADAKNATIVRDKDALAAALAEGGDVVLGTDITVDGSIKLNEGATLYGNGNTLTDAQLTMSEGSKVKDVIFNGAKDAEGSQIYSHGSSITVDGCTFINGNWDAIQFNSSRDTTLTVNNCRFVKHTDSTIGQKAAIHMEIDKEQDSDNNGVPDIAESNNGIKLVLTNTHFDLTQFTTGAKSFANDIVTYGLFMENITASGNTYTDDAALYDFNGDSFGIYYRVPNGNGGYKLAFADGYPTEIIPTFGLSEILEADTADELKNNLAKGDVVLGSDVTVSEKITMAAGATLNGNDKTVTGTDSSVYLLNTTGGTIKNVTVNGSGRAVVFSTADGDVVIDNCVLTAKNYAINGSITESNLIVKNSTLASWVSWGDGEGDGVAYIDNCILGSGNPDMMGTDPLYSAERLQPQTDTTVNNCEFMTGFAISPGKAGITVTLNNCTFNGVKITAENFVDFFGSDPYITTHSATFVVNNVTVNLGN